MNVMRTNQAIAHWALNLPWSLDSYTKIRDGFIYAQEEVTQKLAAHGFAETCHILCYANPHKPVTRQDVPLLQIEIPVDPDAFQEMSVVLKGRAASISKTFPDVPVEIRSMWGDDYISHQVVTDQCGQKQRYLYLLNEPVLAPQRLYGASVMRVLRRSLLADSKYPQSHGVVSEIGFDQGVDFDGLYDAAMKELHVLGKKSAHKRVVHAHVHINNRLAVIPVLPKDGAVDVINRIEVVRGNILSLTKDQATVANFLENHPERYRRPVFSHAPTFLKGL